MRLIKEHRENRALVDPACVNETKTRLRPKT